MSSKNFLNPGRSTYLWGLVTLLLIASLLRLYALTADAPIFLSLSQGVNTDGPVTIGAARDKILFGTWTRHPDQIKQFYLYPALSWLAYLFFFLFDPGYWQANFAIVVTGLLSIVFVSKFAQEHFGRRVAWFSALFMTVNFPYLMYNRIPVVYTPLACGMALALFCWGRGVRRPYWMFLSGVGTAFNIFYIKVAGLAFFPAAVAGLLYLVWQRRRQKISPTFQPLSLFLLGGALVVGVWYFHIFRAESRLATAPYTVIAAHTFDPLQGIEENVRFALVSPLQFGVFSGFFVRLFPLFTLAYGYLFIWGLRLLAKDRPHLSPGEAIVSLFLLSTALMLLASTNRPLRYMILLVPPMSLAAALALDTWLSRDRLILPARFGRFFPIFIQIGLTYFLYQGLAALLKLNRILRLKTGVVDPETILDLPILFLLLVIALILGSFGTLIFLWRVIYLQRPYFPLPSGYIRNWIALIVLLLIGGGGGVQYWSWAKNLQYSVIDTARRVEQDLGEDAILGGAYAYPLSLESDLPAFTFYGVAHEGHFRQVILDAPFTHLAVDADSVLGDAPYNDDRMRENYPELMERAKLYKTYNLRGYLIKVYEIEPTERTK